MPLTRRAIGAVARRLGRPELLAVFYPRAREEQREAVGVGAIIASALPSEATYVYVGTNRGQVLRQALRVAPRGRHIAFEPIPALAAEVTRDFPQVDCRRKALGARQEVTQFCHFKALDGWSGLRRSPEISDELGRPEFITVQVSTLDAELAGVTPALIKIDVEGAELAVLEGGRAILAESRPLLIFEHVSEAAALYHASSQALWELLRELRYEVFSVTGDGPFTCAEFTGRSGVVNWLAKANGPANAG
jgi:FkbM family methyltransferase